MSKPFTLNESYMHSFAKSLLAQWLRESADADGFVNLDPISWRPNRQYCGTRGIWTEYPFGADGEGAWNVWDEALGIAAPTYHQVVAAGIRPACVADIAIGHKGTVPCVIEVVHRHPVPEWKRDFYAKHQIDCFAVPAAEVMCMVRKPAMLPGWERVA